MQILFEVVHCLRDPASWCIVTVVQMERREQS